jgi:uncharacterized protein (TIGR03085 family)
MRAPQPTYSEAMIAEHGRSLARLERAAIADTLDAVGPDAPTLCGDWDAHHLAAHIVLREGTLGEAASPIPGIGDRAVDLLAARRDYVDLVAQVREGPPRLSFFSLPGIDKRFNLLEFYVHHEDVRRAARGWRARALPDWAEEKLSRGLPVMSRVTLRRSPVGVTLVRTDTGQVLTAVNGGSGVTLRGLPSELVLYAFGRTTVADVLVEGDDDSVRTFREQSFSV